MTESGNPVLEKELHWLRIDFAAIKEIWYRLKELERQHASDSLYWKYEAALAGIDELMKEYLLAIDRHCDDLERFGKPAVNGDKGK